MTQDEPPQKKFRFKKQIKILCRKKDNSIVEVPIVSSTARFEILLKEFGNDAYINANPEEICSYELNNVQREEFREDRKRTPLERGFDETLQVLKKIIEKNKKGKTKVQEEREKSTRKEEVHLKYKALMEHVC